VPAVPALDQAPTWPMTTTDLADGERFLVGSLRRWALGLTDNNGEHWRFVWHDFQNRMGARDGKAALASFAGMVAALQVHARRPLRHHHPCCPCVGADELRIVVLVAACQRRDMELAERLAAWMIEAHGTRQVLETGDSLAMLMCRHAIEVPLRVREHGHAIGVERAPALAGAAH